MQVTVTLRVATEGDTNVLRVKPNQMVILDESDSILIDRKLRIVEEAPAKPSKR